MTTMLDQDVLSEVLRTLERFSGEAFPRSERLKFDRLDEFPEETIRRMLSPDLAFHLMFIPAEYGGLGAGVHDITLFSEAMARIELGIATAFLAISLGMDPLRVGGTDPQKQRWMSRIAAEGLIVAYGVTEPGAGSDLSSIKTKATPVSDESGVVTAYRLQGVKQFITNGGVADLYTILAMAPSGPSFFVVERGDEGLHAGKAEEKHGVRLSNTSQVFLDDVMIPADRLVGLVEGRGLAQAVEVFGFTRLMVAAFGLGAGEAALGLAIRYARERRQFGKSLLEFQGYTHRLIVPHAVSLEASRAYIGEIADRLDRGERGLETEGAIAKYFSTESANHAAEAAMQALGGYGYTHDYEVEKIRRDVRITTIYEGTSEILLQAIGKDRWRLFLQTRGEWLEKMAEEFDEIARRNSTCGAVEIALSARLIRRIFEEVRLQKLTRQQHVVFLMAEMITRCDTSAALCRKAIRRSGAGSGDSRFHLIASRISARSCASVVARGAVSCLADYGENSQQLRDIPGLDALLHTGQGLGTDMDAFVPLLEEHSGGW